MKTIRHLTLLLFLVNSCISPSKADELEQLFPIPFLAFVLIPDTPALLEKWSSSLINRSLEDPAIKRFLEPTLESDDPMPWDEVLSSITGHSLLENLQLYQGGVLIGVPAPKEGEEESFFEGENIPLVLIGKVGPDSKAFEDYMAKDLVNTEKVSKKEYDERTEEYLGETLHLRTAHGEDGPEEAEAWAVVDGYAIGAWPQETLREIISNMKKSENAAGIPAGFRRLESITGEQPTTALFFNNELFYPKLKDHALSQLEGIFANNPLGATPETVAKALALDAIQSIGLSIVLERDKVRFDFLLNGHVKQGILGLLSYRNGDLPRPSFIAASAAHVGVARMDFGAAWDSLFSIVKTAVPGFAPMVDMQLAQFESTLGVNLRKDLIGNLGDHFVFSEEPLTDPRRPTEIDLEAMSDYFYAMSLSNQQGFETALGAVRAFLGQGLAAFDEREILGTKVYTYKMVTPDLEEEDQNSSGGIEITHAITGRYFLLGIGSSRPIERALAMLHTPASTIWDLPLIKSFIENIETPFASFEYVNLSKPILALLTLLNESEQAKAAEERFVNPAAMPTEEVIAKYFGAGMTTLRMLDDSGWHSRSTLMAAPPRE